MPFLRISFLLLAIFLIGSNKVIAQVPSELAASYPGLKVSVSVGTKRDQVENSFYMKTMRISPSFTLEGSATRPMPATTATMLIITMDTAEKYRKRRDAYVVWGKETINTPESPSGAKREFSFQQHVVKFDSYRDTSNVGGMVYKYYVFGLRDKASNKLIYFETNHPQLSNLARSNPGKRDEFLALNLKAEFPDTIK